MQARENRSWCFTVGRSWQNNSKILDQNMQNTTGNTIAPAQHELPTVLQRMSDAINTHDVDALLSCLTPDYQGEQPLHPEIASIGLAQVRENWTGLFAQVPDLRATLVAATIHGDFAWAEWHWQGKHTSGSALNLRGVSVAGLRNGIMAWARIYMEPIHDRSSTG
jgi:ketosteroid isomerase-like protein